MTYLIQNNKVVGKTRERLNDDLKVYFCYLPDNESDIKTMREGLIRKRDDVFKAYTSNDEFYKEQADELCYFVEVKSQSVWSVECLILQEPPF